MKLNHVTCESLGRKSIESGKTIKKADGLGLFLQAMPNGSAYWRFKYRYAGKEKLLALGVYPQVSLKEAREKRDWARKLLEDNRDPSLVKKENRLEAYKDSDNTFEKLAREWFKTREATYSPKHVKALIARFERDVFPHIGNFPINAIKPAHILELCKKVEARKAYDTARRIKQTSGQIFRYGVGLGLVERDPTNDINNALQPTKTKHNPVISINELPELIRTIESSETRISYPTRLALKLIMLTFVRTKELITAEWHEIDFEKATWIIPAHKMKMKREHIVPLSKQALEILYKLKEIHGHYKYVFPSHINSQKHMCNATLCRAMSRMGYKDRMTVHGFRGLAMTTIIEQLGYRYEVPDRQLAHAPKSKIDAAYNRSTFLDDRRTMMQDYANYIDEIAK